MLGNRPVPYVGSATGARSDPQILLKTPIIMRWPAKINRKHCSLRSVSQAPARVSRAREGSGFPPGHGVAHTPRRHVDGSLADRAPGGARCDVWFAAAKARGSFHRAGESVACPRRFPMITPELHAQIRRLYFGEQI